MTCENGETPQKAEESTRGVNTFRAARQLERFMMGVNPDFRFGLSDLGDEHLTAGELAERREQERSRMRSPRSFGKKIATITYHPDQQQVEIVRTDSKESTETDL